ATNRGGEPARRPATGQPLGERRDDLSKSVDVDGGPVAPVDHPHAGVGPDRAELSVREDVAGGLRGALPEIGDDLEGRVIRNLWTGAAQRRGSRRGQVPVDELRHVPTVPGRSP